MALLGEVLNDLSYVLQLLSKCFVSVYVGLNQTEEFIVCDVYLASSWELQACIVQLRFSEYFAELLYLNILTGIHNCQDT